uniref:GBF1-like tetratricopeptide repeats domain-containing protein n=1 Tax=Globodera rostochiensis TaxID=31243 RepID=A0A914I2R9_GLORO
MTSTEMNYHSRLDASVSGNGFSAPVQLQQSRAVSPSVDEINSNSSPPPTQSLPFRMAANGVAGERNDTARHWQQWDSPEAMAVAFGENKKAQMAARAMFELVHQYGDNLREGWKNVLDCLLYMLKANLLPSPLVQLNDFVEPSGFALLKERFKRRLNVPRKEESGLLSWLGLTSGSGAGGGESGQSRPRSEEEKELSKLAASVVAECRPEQMVLDSRYLASSSLTELVNSIIHCSFTVAPILYALHGTHQQQLQEQHPAQQQQSQQESQDEDSFVDLSNVAVPPAESLQRVPMDSTDQQPLIRQAAAGSTFSIESTSSGDGRNSPQHLHNGHSNGPTVVKLSMEEEEAMVFLLELMTNIVLENRDRLAQVWSPVRDHLRTLLSHFPHNQQLVERAVIAIIRIANRNLFRLGQHPPAMALSSQPSSAVGSVQTQPSEMPTNLRRQKPSQGIPGQTKSVVIVVDPMDDQKQQRVEGTKGPPLLATPGLTIQDRASNCADDVLHFMGCELLGLRPPELFLFSRQIAFGLHQLLRTNAANLHASEHWEMFLALLEAVGAAAYRDEVDGGEMVELPPPPPPNVRGAIFKRGTTGVLAPNLSRHDPAAFLKVCEILAFLARDAAHITPSNFMQFTRCLRIMVEASLDGGKCAPIKLPPVAYSSPQSPTNGNPSMNFSVPNSEQTKKNGSTEKQQQIEEGDRVNEQERLANCYMDACLQLLNICAQLHVRAATIHKEWSTADGVVATDRSPAPNQPQLRAVPTELWTVYWRPLLQAIARLSCDCRRQIRTQALDALGASFRVPAMGELMQPADWEDCFAEVLFPLLSKLLARNPPISPMDPIGMEEARIRAIQFTCKVLLGNLTQISRLDTFADLLSHLFDLMDQFLEESTCSDLLAEVIQESLKNCVLVCENFGIFHDNLAGLHGELQERLIALAKKHGNASAGPIKMKT